MRVRCPPWHSRRLSSVALALGLAAAASAAAAAPSSRFQLVRSTSGSRGAPGGSRFVMEDPRSEFQAGKDRQVLVLFEWRGPLGPHECEARWKDPSGRTVFTSQSAVNARTTRFAVYWGLSLPDAVATGNWVVEATVDGEPAGVHVFRILSDPVAPGPQRRGLALAEIFKHALGHTLGIEVLDARGVPVARTTGFLLTPTLALTSFSGINAAHALRVAIPGAARVDTTEVVSWNRREDWAVLRLPGSGGEVPLRAAGVPEVGDRCFVLDAQRDGGQVILDTAVVGRTDNGDLFLGEVAGGDSYGGAVWNEYGEIVSVLVGRRAPGSPGLDGLSNLGFGGMLRGTRARPVPAAPSEGAVSRTLQDLTKSGVFVPRLVSTPHFVSGVMATGIGRQGQRGDVPVATDQRFRFTRADPQCLAFMTWTPAVKEDALLHFELRDEDNNPLGASEARKVRMQGGETFVQWWRIEIAAPARHLPRRRGEERRPGVENLLPPGSVKRDSLDLTRRQ